MLLFYNRKREPLASCLSSLFFAAVKNVWALPVGGVRRQRGDTKKPNPGGGGVLAPQERSEGAFRVLPGEVDRTPLLYLYSCAWVFFIVLNGYSFCSTVKL